MRQFTLRVEESGEGFVCITSPEIKSLFVADETLAGALAGLPGCLRIERCAAEGDPPRRSRDHRPAVSGTALPEQHVIGDTTARLVFGPGCSAPRPHS